MLNFPFHIVGLPIGNHFPFSLFGFSLFLFTFPISHALDHFFDKLLVDRLYIWTNLFSCVVHFLFVNLFPTFKRSTRMGLPHYVVKLQLINLLNLIY